jgi:hypothetical protein
VFHFFAAGIQRLAPSHQRPDGGNTLLSQKSIWNSFDSTLHYVHLLSIKFFRNSFDSTHVKADLLSQKSIWHFCDSTPKTGFWIGNPHLRCRPRCDQRASHLQNVDVLCGPTQNSIVSDPNKTPRKDGGPKTG